MWTSGAIDTRVSAICPDGSPPGDLLVINTSGTMNAALDATTPGGEPFELHVSTRLPGGFWTVELRVPGASASLPCHQARAGTTLRLPAVDRQHSSLRIRWWTSLDVASRLWMAALIVPDGIPAYLARYGFPIRYGYVKQPWPSSMYQTVFANEMGSAEMPSAGRPFTPELVTRLVSSGIQIAPVLLHTGVASLEDHEPPDQEFYPRLTRDSRAGQRRPARRTSRHRGGHDRRARARDRDRRAQHDGGRGRLDEPLITRKTVR